MTTAELPRPLRYSEDLDYVRSTAGGIGELTGGAIANLRAKLARSDFRHDIDQLTVLGDRGYDPDRAAELIIDTLLTQVGSTEGSPAYGTD